MPRPLCFMVMPYGRKGTQAEPGKGPGEIDFNALWDRAYVPAIKALGYEPIRADQDTGALIITQMLERLYFADLVLADMTIANGNVYYEVGIRHAAQRKGCVLLAADWSKPLFDVAQMRTVRYPLPEGNILPETATAIQQAIQARIARLACGMSPMHAAVKGYPNSVDLTAASSMQAYLRDLAELQGSIRIVRAMPGSQRMAQAEKLVSQYGGLPIQLSVALALVRTLREAVDRPQDWTAVLDFISSLPPEIADEAEFLEHQAFALSNMGQHLAAASKLEGLIQRFGPTPERLGLLGGRYKRLMQSAAPEHEQLHYLNSAIAAYERGMDLDLNEYFCSSNLPRLYRKRNRKGDESKALSVLSQVIIACDRAIKRGTPDEWLYPTRLTAAFDLGDADKAEELADDVDIVGTAPYKLESIVKDLEASTALVLDPDLKQRLHSLVQRFRLLLSPTDERLG